MLGIIGKIIGKSYRKQFIKKENFDSAEHGKYYEIKGGDNCVVLDFEVA
jgi:hypothetical protein